MKVLITGGAGFVGRATVRALVESGHAVRVLSREPTRSRELFASLGVDVRAGDAGESKTIALALGDIEAIVQGAAAYSYDRYSTGLLAGNASLARTILQAALDAGTPKVVDLSSLVVFALGHSSVDENTPLTGPGDRGWTDPYLRSKVEAELVGRELEAAGLPRVTIHPGTVIGPDDAAIGPSGALVSALLAGGPTPDSGAPWVDVRDVARGIVLALGAPAGSRFAFTSGAVRHRDTARIIDGLTGRHPGRLFLGGGAMRFLARLNDLVGGRASRAPARDAIDWLLDNAPEVDTTRATRDLGMAFRPLPETLSDTIRWWVEHSRINRRLAGRLA